MYQKQPIRSLSKRAKANTIRFTFNVTQDTYNKFAQIMEKRPHYFATHVFADVIDFAHRHGVYDERGFQVVSNEAVLATKQEKPEDREEWCAKYGGEMQGNICKYTKYEVTPTGTIMKLTQSLPIKQMPKTEDEFRKFILGKFGTAGQAESAYVAQNNSVEISAERTVGGMRRKSS
jgi:hypothetical protein